MCPKHEVWAVAGTVMPLKGEGETMLSESSEIDREVESNAGEGEARQVHMGKKCPGPGGINPEL